MPRNRALLPSTVIWRTAAIAAALVGALAGSALAQDAPPDEGAPSVEATGDGSFAVQPSGPDGPGTRDWFVYTLDPGAVWGDTVAISNLGDHPMRFRIYATDAVSVPDSGGFAALQDDDTPVDVGTWIHLAADEYVVEPGTRIDVPFSITVPEDAEPGDHAGAILAVDADAGSVDPSTASEGISFDVRTRIGARVYVRVTGDAVPALRIDSLDVEQHGGDATVTWAITNTGNLRLSPTAEVRITGLFGRTVATAPLQQLAELLPGANLIGGTAVGGLPSYERLTAHLVLKAEGVEVEGSTSFGSALWLLVLVVVVLLVLLGWWMRRRRRHRAAVAPPAKRQRVPVGA